MSLKRNLGYAVGVVGVLAAFVNTGCIVRTTARTPTVRASVNVPTPPPPPAATVTVTATSPTIATGVTVVETACVQGAQEVCNGLDDNCNGQIDEGCGYSSGNIQITLAWNTGADLDLYVTDPTGQTISYQNRQANGGHLDRDARGACGSQNGGVENVYWNQNNPQRGNYQVAVDYWSGSTCSTNSGPTPLTLSISVGGQVIGAYNYVLNPNQNVPLASFQL